MLGTLPGHVSQPFEVTSRTVRTVQMCSQAGDTANNSLQLESTRGTVMCVNHLPLPVGVLGGIITFLLDGAGSTDNSVIVRPPTSKPAITHGYFTWSQNKRQDTAAKAIAGQKCSSDTPKPKPNTGSSNKAKKQMTAALDVDRGWTNKTQVQGGIAPTNDTNLPSHLKVWKTVKGIQGSGWLGPVTQSSSVA